MSNEDIALLEKFKKLLKITQNVKQSRVAKILGLSKEQLLEKLIEWGDFLPFKIQDDTDLIVVDDLDGFFDALDEQFATWGKQEHAKNGKVEAIEAKLDVAHPTANSTRAKKRKPAANPRSIVKLKSNINSKPVSPGMKDYHGTPLALPEWEVMNALEHLLKKPVPRVENVEWELKGRVTEGFLARDGHIIQLGLHIVFKEFTFLPEIIGCLTSLQILDIEHNHLTSLPETIGNLTALKEFYLCGNYLASLPDTIGNLTSLEKLDLTDNHLSSLPETIGQLSSLKELILDGNQLISLPWTIDQLKSLQNLDISFNNLSSFPETIINLKSLSRFSLGFNQLTSLPEPITTWIKNLRKEGCKVLESP